MILRKCSNLDKTAEVKLPASKSIANRVLLAAKLAGIELHTIDSLSDSEDTKQLFDSLNLDNELELNISEGAAPLRFLLAYRAAKNLPCIIYCGERLFQRPLEAMTKTLNAMGAAVEMRRNAIFIRKGIKEFGNIEIDASQSSQFASALMLVAPLFPGDKVITWRGTPTSRSYLQMTAGVMKQFGIESSIGENQINIKAGNYQPTNYKIEKDWSAAAFFYAMVSVFNGPEVLMKGLWQNSLQGDSQAADMFRYLGVETKFLADGVLIRKSNINKLPAVFDFRDCPDLAPSIIAAAAATGKDLKISGVENLRFKESDRIEAIKYNLALFGANLIPSKTLWRLQFNKTTIPQKVHLNDFNDHRIAMAFSVFSKISEIHIPNPDCVSKSFPAFWEECKPWFEVEV